MWRSQTSWNHRNHVARPRKSTNSCFCHFPASSLTPWLQAKAYLLQIIHLKTKTHLLPRNDRVAWLADELPGAMISALMKTSEGPGSSIAERVTHTSSVQSGLIAREADPLKCSGHAEFAWMIATALNLFSSKISCNNSKMLRTTVVVHD